MQLRAELVRLNQNRNFATFGTEDILVRCANVQNVQVALGQEGH